MESVLSLWKRTSFLSGIALVIGITFTRILITNYANAHPAKPPKKKKKLKLKTSSSKNKPIVLSKSDPYWNTALFFPCFFPDREDSSFKKLQNYLNHAKNSMKVCVMTISDETLINLLIQKHREGVKVYIFTSYDTASFKHSGKLLKSKGIDVRSLPKSAYSTEMHHKYALVDDFVVLTGSMNWTTLSITQQRENILITTDDRIVPKFVDNFEYLWNKFDQEEDSSDDDD